MHGTVAALAGSAENFETSSKSGRIESLPGLVGGPFTVTVVHAD